MTVYEILRLRCAALRACEEIPPRRQFKHVFEAKLSLKSGVLRINSQALRMTCGGEAAIGCGGGGWVPACARATEGGAMRRDGLRDSSTPLRCAQNHMWGRGCDWVWGRGMGAGVREDSGGGEGLLGEVADVEGGEG